MYSIRANDRGNIHCVGTSVILHGFGCLEMKRAIHRWLSCNKLLILMYMQPCVHEIQD